MSHTFITVIASVPLQDVAGLRTSIMALGNPANSSIAAALDRLATVHFASLNVFEASAKDRGHLVFELSGDGPAERLLADFDRALAPQLTPIFASAADRGSGSLTEFWTAHVVEVGQAPLGNLGLVFAGTPGLSVERIRRERGLVRHIAGLLRQPSTATSASAQLAAIRQQLAASADWRWSLEPEPIVQGGTGDAAPGEPPGVLPLLGDLALPFARTFLTPLIPLPLVIFLIAWWVLGFTAWHALGAFLIAVPLSALALVAIALRLYNALRAREDAESPQDKPPAPGAVAAIMRRENFAAQNHLAALSVMKPGRLRRLTLCLAYWMIAQFSARYFRPGFLGELGTIHFARWVLVPHTNDLLFMSNYGGSWESYLEDFITKAHAGLTGVWSNTVGFPKTTNLFENGATDGERFKRWARRQQIPTQFWYSAYPDLTTANIRTNAAIRQGLSLAKSEDDAQSWLAQFGSHIRPRGELESSDIQSLVFGGLGFLRYGAAVLFGLGDDPAAAKAWLREQLPAVAFADGRRLDNATILGLAASALPKLGLPEEAVATFPPAFVDGMAAPWRARALGDTGPNEAANWWWGNDPAQRIDGVLLIYARDASALDALRGQTAALLGKHGHGVRKVIGFRELPDPRDPVATREQKLLAKCEPFGFVDGLSQPVIRGTYKALRGADPIHLVEPGEFILGYPDDRGDITPGPTLAAAHDPTKMLSVAAGPSPDSSVDTADAARDLGRNGTFLAIRQLEQDVDAFWEFCKAEGQHLRLPPGVRVTPADFVAAKMVGRWRDGSPLVRYPRYPVTDLPAPHPLARTAGAGATAAATAPVPSSPRAARSHPAAPATAAPPAPTEALESVAPSSASLSHARTIPFDPDNDFLFGVEDPQGVRCPFGAHIRRANPRESFEPDSQEQLGITNRHRIIRTGRFYQPQEGQKDGLFFMCLNGNIERQFEFVQQTWLDGAAFHGLVGERDPLLGTRDGGGFTIPTRDGPLAVGKLASFVQMRGGDYFFMAGRRTLQYLAT